MSDVKDQVLEREERKEQRLSTAEMAQALEKREPRDVPQRQESETLLPPDRAEEFRSRWSAIQTSFVDEPRHSVEEADSLVAEVMQYLARTFADERQNLESQWGRGDNVSTEDLRIALQRYRAFFSRLLAV